MRIIVEFIMREIISDSINATTFSLTKNKTHDILDDFENSPFNKKIPRVCHGFHLLLKKQLLLRFYRYKLWKEHFC